MCLSTLIQNSPEEHPKIPQRGFFVDLLVWPRANSNQDRHRGTFSYCYREIHPLLSSRNLGRVERLRGSSWDVPGLIDRQRLPTTHILGYFNLTRLFPYFLTNPLSIKMISESMSEVKMHKREQEAPSELSQWFWSTHKKQGLRQELNEYRGDCCRETQDLGPLIGMMRQERRVPWSKCWQWTRQWGGKLCHAGHLVWPYRTDKLHIFFWIHPFKNLLFASNPIQI